MNKEVIYTQKIEFGDCDPVGIVWFPNYYRWLDAASRNFFISCGVPSWRDTLQERGIIGTPMVKCDTVFVSPASYEDTLVISTYVSKWGRTSFVQHHRVFRRTPGNEDVLVVEAHETRVFASYQEGTLRAVPIPQDYKALCSF